MRQAPPTSRPSVPQSRRTPTLEEEEAMLLDRIDAQITHTEEKEFRERLDLEILRAEEKDLIKRILYSIDKAEAYERAMAKPAVISNVVIVGQKADIPIEEGWCWPTAKVREIPRPPATQPLYQDVQQQKLYSCKHLLPRLWDKGEDPLYSRGEFHTCVVDLVESLLRSRNPLHLIPFEADLQLVHDDPTSYQLTAKGPAEALEELRQVSGIWLRHRIAQYNLESLMEDGESLVVDIEIPRGQKLGASMTSFYRSPKMRLQIKEGVWIMAIRPDGGLCMAMGGLKALEAGCAIVAIDGHICNSPSKLRDLYQNANSEKAIRITVCLPKYADLSEVDLSRIKPRRRDGLSFDPEYYENLELDRWVNASAPISSEDKKSWIEYPPANSPPPTLLSKSPPVEHHEKAESLESVIQNEGSVEVDLALSANGGLGATANVYKRGLWICNFKPGGQLLQVLGEKACTYGAVLYKVNGVLIGSFEQLEQVSRVAKEYDGSFRVTLLFNDGTDLSQVDRTKLVQGRTNPRRRNGQAYPLHLYPQLAYGTKRGENKTMKKRSRSENEIAETISPLSKKSRRKEVEVTSINDKEREDSLKKSRRIQKEKAAWFIQFKQKYKDLVEIEFGRTGIHFNKVCSSMWLQHKKLLPDSPCEDNCKCLALLRSLTKYVISDYIIAQENQGKSFKEDDLQTVGFVHHFAKRFLPLLRKEYPKATTKELNERLVAMWPIHERNLMFGTKCHKDCECVQAWDLVFGKGDKEKAESFKKGSKRSTASLRIKRRKLASGEVAVDANPKDLASAALPRKKTVPLEKRPSLLKEYEVIFDTFSPLGAYFVTEKGSSHTKCKIHSVWDKGQAKSDPRIQRGTVVDSIMVGTTRARINNHSDLKGYYNEARRSKKKLHIVFINSEVTFSMQNILGDRDWNLSGNWQGKCNDGWPGGASVRGTATSKPKISMPTPAPVVLKPKGPKPTPAPVDIVLAEDKSNLNVRSLSPPTIPARRESKNDSGDGWMSITSYATPGHRIMKPSSGILRDGKKSKGKSDKHNRSVRFSASNEEQYFEADSEPREHVARSSESVSADDDTASSVFFAKSPEEAFMNAVQHRTCKELIEVLENGASSDAKAISRFRGQYEKIRDGISLLKKKMRNDSSNLELKQTLTDHMNKRVVMSTYINALFAIEKANTLKNWNSFEFRVQHIELRKASNVYVSGRSNILYGRARVLVSGAFEDLGALPPRTLTEYINYSDEEDSPAFKVANNPYFDQENRVLIIEVEEGVLSDSVPNAWLGSFKIPLNEFEKCNTYNEPINIDWRQVSSDGALRKGEIQLEVKRVRTPSQYIETKKDETVAKILQQIENVARFNEEQGEAAVKLKANIQGEGNISLLHAAILLQQEGLVERLLSLNANPHHRSEIGTPLSLAQSLRHRTKDKLMNEKVKVTPDQASIEAKEHLHALYERIAAVLKTGRDTSKSSSLQSETGQSAEQKLSTSESSLAQRQTSEKAVDNSDEDSLGVRHDQSKNSLGAGRDQLEDSIGSKDDQAEHSIGADHKQSEDSHGADRDQSKDLLEANHDQSEGFSFKTLVSFTEDFVREICLHAPPSVVGKMPFGRAALKSYIMGQLRVKYANYFRNVEAVRNFINEAISSGLLVQRGSGTSIFLFLGSDELPELGRMDWMSSANQKRCFNFNSPDGCRFGSKCHFVHVQAPIGNKLDDDEFFAANFPNVLDKRKVTVKEEGPWHTAAYFDERENKYFYAERGPNFRKSKQNVYWYESAKDAEEALRRVLILSKGIQPESSSSPQATDQSMLAWRADVREDAGRENEVAETKQRASIATYASLDAPMPSWGDNIRQQPKSNAKDQSTLSWGGDARGDAGLENEVAETKQRASIATYASLDAPMPSWGDNIRQLPKSNAKDQSTLSWGEDVL